MVPSPPLRHNNGHLSASRRRRSRYEHLVLLLVMLISVSPLLNEVGRAIAICFIAGISLIDSRYRNPRATVLFFSALALLIPMTLVDLLSLSNVKGPTLSFLYIIAGLTAGFSVSQSLKTDYLLRIFERAFFPVALISFAAYSLFFTFPDIAYSFPSYTYEGYTQKTIYVLNIMMAPAPALRNSGFASEPGVYQLLLNLALYTRLRDHGRVDLRVILYVIAILSTVSTAGLAILAFVLLSTLNNRQRMFAIVIGMFFAGAISALVSGHIQSKVRNELAFDGRVVPSLNAVKYFLQNPLGVGAIRYSFEYKSRNAGSYDSYTQVAMRYGILGLIALWMLLSSVVRRQPVVGFILILTFLTNPLWFVPFVSQLYFPQRRLDGQY